MGSAAEVDALNCNQIGKTIALPLLFVSQLDIDGGKQASSVISS